MPVRSLASCAGEGGKKPAERRASPHAGLKTTKAAHPSSWGCGPCHAALVSLVSHSRSPTCQRPSCARAGASWSFPAPAPPCLWSAPVQSSNRQSLRRPPHLTMKAEPVCSSRRRWVARHPISRLPRQRSPSSQRARLRRPPSARRLEHRGGEFRPASLAPRGGSGPRQRYMCSIMTCPKPEQDTCVAPSINRAKS
jgi:hypothetical protein